MRFLIASDIHGSAPAAAGIADIYRDGGYDRLLLLGDLLYHGPRNDLPAGYEPKKVIRILSELKDEVLSVKGNCEAEVDQMVLPFPVLSESAMVFADGMRIFMTHGHLWSEERHPDGIDAFFSGHTHIALLEKKDGYVHLNPGSLSLPKDGTGGSYATWENGNIKLVKLDGSVIAESGV